MHQFLFSLRYLQKKVKGAGPKWFHKADDLLRGVDYAARYFGCAKVEGPESTKQAGVICQKLQVSIITIQDLIHNIILDQIMIYHEYFFLNFFSS